ncbi:MAG: DNA methyltransferase [Bacteroidetes bacterium]|nr:DNA methyltransferase [Bacteroidota bacterium]
MYKRKYSSEWDFRNSNTKEYTHCYHNYPAMMIPQIARKLITEFAPSKKINLILDPYMGSGTTLVESSIRGINSIGFDINPLARFIAEVKISTFNVSEIKCSYLLLCYKLDNFNPNEYQYNENDYVNITKHEYWYSNENLVKLKYLSTSIDDIENKEIKPFFLLALSEIIREVSYTRNGEFKRYRIEKSKIPTYNPNPFLLFKNKIIRNLKGLESFILNRNDCNAIVLDCNSIHGIPNSIIKKNSVDMVVTSPPYGDSKTTVAYGQYSRWSSEWFNFPNAKNIDKTLMGGIPIVVDNFKTNSIYKELELIKNIDIKRYYEVVTFLSEYSQSIKNISTLIRKGGRICYVVGNRTVKKVQIPLDYFTAEIFEQNGFKHDITYVRSIPNKRMPLKTSPTNKKGINVSTMTEEYIVIMTKINSK